MKITDIRQSAEFEPAALSGNAKQVYLSLYGEHGEDFYNTLIGSPPEIAVVTRLFAHINQLVSELNQEGAAEEKEENNG